MTDQEFEDWGASVPHGVEAHFYPVCASTNEVASSYLRAGNSHSPVWIIAGSQSGGKGRKGRPWVSNEGNLYASLAFRPTIAPKDLGALPFLIALAARDTLIDLGLDASEVQCKWPNDILVSGKKICGILIESSARSAQALDYVIVGIGINLLHSPEEALFKATSVKRVLGDAVTVQKALAILSAKVKYRLDHWTVDDFEPTRREWTDSAWGLGQTRLINTSTEAFDAQLIGLDTEGGLLVKLENGEQRQIVAADIFPVANGTNKGT